jgi:hypothetical protein
MADQSAVNFGFSAMFDTVGRLKFWPPVVGNAILLASRSKLEVNKRCGTSRREQFEREKCANVRGDLNPRRLQRQAVNELITFLGNSEK